MLNSAYKIDLVSYPARAEGLVNMIKKYSLDLQKWHHTIWFSLVSYKGEPSIFTDEDSQSILQTADGVILGVRFVDISFALSYVFNSLTSSDNATHPVGKFAMSWWL